MEIDVARALTSPLGAEALRLAAAQSDPRGLAAASALRAHFEPELAAAALSQETLRRRAKIKFGSLAGSLFLTPNALEQASRPAVAQRRAERMIKAGARRVVDLGCGIGADAMAFAAAGLEVIAVELDPATAHFSEANLGRVDHESPVRVIGGDVERVWPEWAESDAAVYCDPARRDGQGRVWSVDQFTPPWSLVQSLLAGDRLACIKLGPALPHALIPDGVEAEWVSDHGDVVEVALWAGGNPDTGGARADARVATVLPGGDQLVRREDPPVLEISKPLRYLYEPNGAVIRAGGVTIVGEQLGAALLDEKIAYLTASAFTTTPFATAFEVLEVLPYKEKILKAWVRDHDIGTLEIKKRGLEIDPAQLRKQLKPHGKNAATLVLTRTQAGARVLVVQRVS